MLRSLLFILCFAALAESKRLPDIYWNSTNPHLEMCAAIDDLVDFRCPFGRTKEQAIIYRVSKEEYDECRLSESSKEVGRCIDPKKETKLKIAFRMFQPNPYALTYQPETTYYFISTSTGSSEGLTNREGGLCTTHALKMKLQVVKRGAPCHTHRKHHHHKTTTVAPTVVREIPFGNPYRLPAPEERREEWILTPSMPLERIEKTLNRDSGEDSMLWDHFYQKLDATPMREEPKRTRGERVALDTKTTEYKLDDAYEALAGQILDGQVMFQIHEIGDEPDSLPWRSSSQSTLSSSTTVILLLLVVLLR